MFEQTLDPSQGYGQAGGFDTPAATPPRMPARWANGTDTWVDSGAMSSTSTATWIGATTCGTERSLTPESPHEEI
jgi:hypothetical protein